MPAPPVRLFPPQPPPTPTPAKHTHTNTKPDSVEGPDEDMDLTSCRDVKDKSICRKDCANSGPSTSSLATYRVPSLCQTHGRPRDSSYEPPDRRLLLGTLCLVDNSAWKLSQ